MTTIEEVEPSDPAFLERVTVNFIRHALTEEDESLEEVARRIGVDEAMALIRKPVLLRSHTSIPNLPERANGRYGLVMGAQDATG